MEGIFCPRTAPFTFSSGVVWSSVCLTLFLEESAAESEHMCMSEMNRLAVISPVPEVQEINGEETGIFSFQHYPVFFSTGSTTVTVLLLLYPLNLIS